MAVRCAKPGCADHAEAWFLTARAACVVEVHEAPVDGAIALCASHLARFSVPNGWRVEQSQAVAVARPAPETAERQEPESRRPWFSSVAAPTEQVPVAGGLLSRAFNGPQPVS